MAVHLYLQTRRVFMLLQRSSTLLCVLLLIAVTNVTITDSSPPLPSSSYSIRCYSCTTLNADSLLSDVQDTNWKRWLENVRFVPRTEECNDRFSQIAALRSGVMAQECENGVCLKVWFRERKGDGQVWRTCIPNADKRLRPDCTKISSGEGNSLQRCKYYQMALITLSNTL